MNARTSSRYFMFLFLIITAALASQAYAQMGGGEFAATIAENSEKLKQYTYTQKTQVYFKGELRTTKMSQVHFDPTTGEKVVVPMDMGDAAQQPEQGRGGRLRERIVEKKRDEMKEYVERLVGLMHQYLPPNPDRIKAAMPRAQMTPPAGGGDAKIALSDYLKPGDTVTFSMNLQAKKLDQIAINSSLDSDPVSFIVDFARLADDTNYPSMTNIKSEAKGLEIRVTTSDYHK
jgi:hypothetical protein